MKHSPMHRRRWISPATSSPTRNLLVSLVILAACAPLPAAALGHFKCSIVETIQLPFERAGHRDYLTHYTCQITGGQLDGFVVDQSTRWEINGNGRMLLGSLGLAKKGTATVMYEADEGMMRNFTTADEHAVGWDSTVLAKIKGATGSAAHLGGKTFIIHGRLIAPGKLLMDAVLAK